MSLNGEEMRIVSDLHRNGLSVRAATLAVAMVTREHSRPENELLDIVRQYQNLEDSTDSLQAIGELKKLGWLVKSEWYGQDFIQQAPNLRDKIGERLNDSKVAARLKELRANLGSNIRFIGPMNDKVAYTSYLDLLHGAQREICLPMLGTSPNLSSVPIIKERARRGVRVRILLGSPDVVMEYRGRAMRTVAEDAISGWSRHIEGIKQAELRISKSKEDMIIATCMSIDSRILRFDIYDPLQQRSLQGFLIEAESPPGFNLNLVDLFQRYFDSAWRAAQPIQFSGKVQWWVRRGWRWAGVAIFSLLTVLTATSVWGLIFGSAAGTFLVNAVVSWRRSD